MPRLRARSLLAGLAALPLWGVGSAPAAETVGLANPASVHCLGAGGRLEIRTEQAGEVGYCLFADGSECEEWALFRGECAQGGQRASFDDPFAYCAAVGTLDAPDARYTGEQPPAAVLRGLREVFDAPADAPDAFFAGGTHWRCAEGRVKACFVGANLPCKTRADASRIPNQGTLAFCRENPDAAIVPAAATGRATVFAWRCEGGTPAVDRQVGEVDEQGYQAGIWYFIEKPGR